MIYVDLSKLIIPVDLQERLKRTSDELVFINDPVERNTYIKNHASLWSEAKPCLTTILGENERDYKCWYCETKAARFDFVVDHFRPKNRVKNKNKKNLPGYWWLAFEPKNYRLACGYCNSTHRNGTRAQGKADQFPLDESCKKAANPLDSIEDEVPLLLDPTNRIDPGLLAFSEDGRVYSYYEDDSFACKRANITIEVLNLDDIRIEEARKVMWRQCLEKVEQGTNEFIKYQRHRSPAAKRVFDKICEDIIETVAPHAQFSSMARYCYEGTGQKWVLALLKAA